MSACRKYEGRREETPSRKGAGFKMPAFATICEKDQMKYGFKTQDREVYHMKSTQRIRSSIDYGLHVAFLRYISREDRGADAVLLGEVRDIFEVRTLGGKVIQTDMMPVLRQAKSDRFTKTLSGTSDQSNAAWSGHCAVG